MLHSTQSAYVSIAEVDLGSILKFTIPQIEAGHHAGETSSKSDLIFKLNFVWHLRSPLCETGFSEENIVGENTVPLNWPMEQFNEQ